MGLISRLGKWIDSRWPEKIAVEEVFRSLTAYAQIETHVIILENSINQFNAKIKAFETGAQSFDKSLTELKDEVNKVKAVQAIANRSRVSPVMPSGEPWKR